MSIWLFLFLALAGGSAVFFLRIHIGGSVNALGPETLLRCDFEGNLFGSGWEFDGMDGEGVETSVESDNRAISVRSGSLRSPVVSVRANEWYRIGFRSKTQSEHSGVPRAERFRCRLVYVLRDAGKVATHSEFFIGANSKWGTCEYLFRVHSELLDPTSIQPEKMRVEFDAAEGDCMQIDDISFERSDAGDARRSMDFWDSNAAKPLQYLGNKNRGIRLKKTLAKLRNHEALKIVLVEEADNSGMANLTMEDLLSRHYPGTRPEQFSIKLAVPIESGIRTCISAVLALKPDLIVMDGARTVAGLEWLRMFVEEVRRENEVSGKVTEWLVLTYAFGSFDETLEPKWLDSGMRELDQDVMRNDLVPDDYRGRLMLFAAAHGIEFLDTAGILSEYVFNNEGFDKAGPVAHPDAVSPLFWSRDWMQSSMARHVAIMRILDTYFAPPGVGAQAVGEVIDRGARKSVKVFDPVDNPLDQGCSERARKAFGIVGIENAVMAIECLDVETEIQQKRALGNNPKFRVQAGTVRKRLYSFDTPIDVRKGDIVVYWSFRSDRSGGELDGALDMNLCGTNSLVESREGAPHVGFAVRPVGPSILSVVSGEENESDMEQAVDSTVENFLDSERVGKFRLVLRWDGGDRIFVEPGVWSDRTKRWEAFIRIDRPGAGPVLLELSISRQLAGSSVFRSLAFNSFSAIPQLEHILVTTRPGAIR